MLLRKSRYQNSKSFTPAAQSSVEDTFAGVTAREVTTLEGVIEHLVTDNDRLDHLARHYFNDDRLWWRIVDANPELMFADNLLGPDWYGRAILIPTRR